MSKLLPCFTVLAFLLCPDMALATGHPTVPGAELAVYWVTPFVCMLLSIAIMPLLAPHFWEQHFGKISIFWALAFLVPCAFVFGFSVFLSSYKVYNKSYPKLGRRCYRQKAFRKNKEGQGRLWPR